MRLIETKPLVVVSFLSKDGQLITTTKTSYLYVVIYVFFEYINEKVSLFYYVGISDH